MSDIIQRPPKPRFWQIGQIFYYSKDEGYPVPNQPGGPGTLVTDPTQPSLSPTNNAIGPANTPDPFNERAAMFFPGCGHCIRSWEIIQASALGPQETSPGNAGSLAGWSVVELAITKTHIGNFEQGGDGSFTITVTNDGGSPTSGTVTVTEITPPGLTFVSMSGTGWTINGNVATRSDVLEPSDSYPPLTVNVTVAADAASPQVNEATVSGGGSIGTAEATDSVTIVTPPPPAELGLFAATATSGSGENIVQSSFGPTPANAIAFAVIGQNANGAVFTAENSWSIDSQENSTPNLSFASMEQPANDITVPGGTAATSTVSGGYGFRAGWVYANNGSPIEVVGSPVAASGSGLSVSASIHGNGDGDLILVCVGALDPGGLVLSGTLNGVAMGVVSPGGGGVHVGLGTFIAGNAFAGANEIVISANVSTEIAFLAYDIDVA